MSDWGTLIRRLQDDSHSAISAQDAGRRAVDSMRFHREKRLWWSERQFQLKLTPGISVYKPGDGWGLPEDLFEIASKSLRIRRSLTSQSADFYICRATSDEMDHYKAADTSQGDPLAWDWYQGSLEFWPPPREEAWAEGRYMRNLEIPVVRWDGSSYTFILPSTEAAVPDNWTCDWISQDGSGELIYARAMMLISKHLKDPEAEQAYMTLWLEQTAQTEDEHDVRTAGDSLGIRPRFF